MTKTTRTPRHMSTTPVPVEQVAQSILLLRGNRVILDRELAAIYGVSTGRLNEAVKRNIERFPEDFMFQLTREEAERSRSQFAILNSGRGQNIKHLPFAFTEHGAIQAANILSSPRAVEMGIYVVRAFVKLRDLLSSNRELARRFAQLETRLIKSSPSTMRPSLPSSPPSVSSWEKQRQLTNGSNRPVHRPIWRRSRNAGFELGKGYYFQS
jgi:hypothetical protein